MTFEIQLPHVGESVTEAVIEKWLKQPGDKIEKYEPIVEVVTDKVAMEVPSPATGELTRIVAAEGETVAMGAVIAEMNAEGPVDVPSPDEASPAPESGEIAASPIASRANDAGEQQTAPGLRRARTEQVGSMITAANVGPTGGAFSDTSLEKRSASESVTEEQEHASATPAKEFARLSPAVRRLIEQHELDPASISGTGVGGRITRQDVLKAVESGASGQQRSAAQGELRRPTAVRRMIAEHMMRSFREIPHAWSAIEVDVSGLVACRAANRESVQANHGISLTYLPFAIAVTSAALRSNPLLNSSWQDNGILVHSDVNMGIAVAGKDGLVVPVLKSADQKSVLELAIELSSVVDRARNGALSLDDVSGGTFTLNNTGALGSVWGGAIINHPQAAILTTEAIVKRPVATDTGSVEVRPMMNICLSFDHRVIDGAEAAEFLQQVKTGLQSVSAETALE